MDRLLKDVMLVKAL